MACTANCTTPTRCRSCRASRTGSPGSYPREPYTPTCPFHRCLHSSSSPGRGSTRLSEWGHRDTGVRTPGSHPQTPAMPLDCRLKLRSYDPRVGLKLRPPCPTPVSATPVSDHPRVRPPCRCRDWRSDPGVTPVSPNVVGALRSQPVVSPRWGGLLRVWFVPSRANVVRNTRRFAGRCRKETNRQRSIRVAEHSESGTARPGTRSPPPLTETFSARAVSCRRS